MPNGPFPNKDALLNQYFGIVFPFLNLAANTTRLGVSVANKTALGLDFTAWNLVYPLSQNPDTATSTVFDNKDIAEHNMKSILRTIYADIPESALTSQDRNTLHLPVHSTTHTASAVPTTKPVGNVDTSKHLEHTISFVDSATPTSRAKPDGVRGCQIWVKIGSPVTDPKELTYLATDTKSPYVNHFDGADANKTAYYWLRWENTRGEVGPWSDPAIGSIPV